MPRKTNYVPSKIQTKVECFICHKDMSNGLDHHHCLHGSGQRKLADEDGLWVWLCRICHSALHDTGANDRYLQALAQRTYINELIHQGYPQDVARELFFSRYKKFYEYEDGK